MGESRNLSRGTIAYLGSFDFPHRNAAANLALATAGLIAASGYNVVICGRRAPGAEPVDVVVQAGVVLRLRPMSKRWIDRINLIRLYAFYLSSLRSEEELSMVIAYNMPALVLAGVLVWARLRDIPVIAHCTEWYARVPWRTGFPLALARNLDTALRMRLVHRSVDGLLVSSHFLADFYRGKPTLVYPTLSVNLAPGHARPRSSQPQVVYAGEPFAPDSRNIRPGQMKDRLDLILELLGEAQRAGARFRFDIFGITRDAYLVAVPRSIVVLEGLANSVVFHGRVSSTEVATAIRDADYTILIRDRNRVTLAGFPTKFSESVLQGTPVLANAVGEIERYLRVGINGYQLSGGRASVRQVMEALALGPKERAALKERCARGSRNLSTAAWIEPMGDFVTRVGAEVRSGGAR